MPAAVVIGDVGIVTDGVELVPDELAGVGAGDIVMPVEPDIGVEEFAGPDDDVPPLGVEDTGDDGDNVGAVCGNSSEIPVLPSTDPVWTLAIGLQGVDTILVGAGVGFGGGAGAGFDEVWAAAVDAHAIQIQMNTESFISNLLCRSAALRLEIFCKLSAIF